MAARAIRVGEVLEAADLRTVDGELPGGAAGFADVDALVGRVALGPIGEGEIVQAGSVTDEPATPACTRWRSRSRAGRSPSAG